MHTTTVKQITHTHTHKITNKNNNKKGKTDADIVETFSAHLYSLTLLCFVVDSFFVVVFLFVFFSFHRLHFAGCKRVECGIYSTLCEWFLSAQRTQLCHLLLLYMVDDAIILPMSCIDFEQNIGWQWQTISIFTVDQYRFSERGMC